jgi:MoaA/NifB/PqqE/SkfB family radical SAM enzyme
MDKYFMDGHKLYWHLDRVVAWQRGETVPPVYVEISPVSFCNHKCIFCGIDFARDTGYQLDAEVLGKRLEEMGVAGVRSVMFAGEGEPLLHRNLPEFAGRAKSSGMDVSVATNGSLGTRELWKDLLPPLSWIRFSVDAGTPEVYSRVHRVQESSFHKTVESIRHAVDVKRENNHNVTIGVQYLLLKDNLEDIENALQLFSGIGVDYLSFKPFSLHPLMLQRTDMDYTQEVIDGIDETVEGYRQKSAMNVIFRKTGLAKYQAREKAFAHCYALPFWGHLSAKGDFHTCGVFLGDERFSAGNIYTEDMRALFFGAARQKSLTYGREKLPISRECRVNCRMARVNEFLEFLENRPDHVNFI